MNKIIDFHTHAFPDDIAHKAIVNIEKAGGIKSHHNGTISGLLKSMDESGISTSVICSIATKPSQFYSIMNWSKKIRSDRIEPFLSFHPLDKDAIQHIKQIKNEGFLGIKLHPYYQDFFIDEPAMFPFYATIAELGLILIKHSGYDFAFPQIPRANPFRLLSVIKKIPSLRIIAAHLGGWQQWDEVEKFLVGENIFFETSFSLNSVDLKTTKKIIIGHPHEKILFGSDSPWTDQKEALECFRQLQLPDNDTNLILKDNAEKLLML